MSSRFLSHRFHWRATSRPRQASFPVVAAIFPVIALSIYTIDAQK
ncbi:hypothetical protein DDI_0553 [Dickeya dianthicola RNS04.9]|nr:hypothetical protein DDI_0553 [Dickeya dianthicola RNS04.9]